MQGPQQSAEGGRAVRAPRSRLGELALDETQHLPAAGLQTRADGPAAASQPDQVIG
ncbi:MAG TPA: hypothetical protein VGD91_24445 [Trebonia sp.]